MSKTCRIVATSMIWIGVIIIFLWILSKGWDIYKVSTWIIAAIILFVFLLDYILFRAIAEHLENQQATIKSIKKISGEDKE